MIKLTFKMSPESYWLGYKYRKQKGANKISASGIMSILLVIIFIALNIFVGFDPTLVFCALLAIVFPFITMNMEKKTIIQSFSVSPVLYSEHTLTVYDGGIEIINSYEKYFAPWEGIFAVKDTPQYITILPTFHKGIFVIDKTKAQNDIISQLLDTLKNHNIIDGGKI